MSAPADPSSPVIALGLMSGTSMDGIDLALVETDGVRVVRTGPWRTVPYEAGLRARLAAAVAAGPALAPVLEAGLEAALTDAHAAAVAAFRASLPADWREIGVVGFHGHTLWHRPDARATRQIGDGDRLAAHCRLPVVADFRRADVAAGGQGAPLVPVVHAALAAGLERPLAVLNLGGVGNVTWIGADEDALLAFDTGPGNALLDDWAQRHLGMPCDRDGALAAAGRADAAALARLLEHPHFAAPPPKSLDRDAFSPDPAAALSPADGAATLAAFTVRSVALAQAHLPQPPRRWLVCGGGRHNPVLMAGLRAALPVPVDPVEAVGWDGDAVEAQAFAVLAVRSLRGLPLTLPGTTGAPHPLTGGTLHRPDRATALAS